MNRMRGLDLVFLLLYLVSQVFLFKNLVLFNVGFCFPYVAFILFLPIDISALLLIIIGFSLGLAVDGFYNSPGLHAGALTLLAFVRNFWLARIAPQGGYDTAKNPTLYAYGIRWIVVYTFPLIFLHHAVLFFIEVGQFALMGYTFLKIGASSLFTLFIILFLQYLLPSRKKS